MTFNFDVVIFTVFLIINLLVGLYYGIGVNKLKDYAIGNRNFSTGTLAATIIATWIGGGFFAFNLSKAYIDSLPFVIAVTGNALALLILSYFYSLRMSEFLGCTSVAEIMGKLFGKNVQIITAICVICLCTGYIGLQIKVLANMMHWSFGISPIKTAAIASSIVIIYSAFGGIRSVTFTDVLQFLTFGSFIPAISIMIFQSIDFEITPIALIAQHPHFDVNELMTVGWLTMFLWFIIPCMDPTLTQRILLASSVFQARKSFALASLGCLVIIILTSWIAMLLYTTNPNIKPDQLFTYIMSEYSYPGIRGITMAGIAAMVMSTVDSYINSASVIFAQDLCKPLKFNIGDNLPLARIFAVSVGILGMIIALTENSFYGLTLLITNFYMPIVTVPLTLAIFGFRSTSYSVLSAMASGFITVIIWRNFIQEHTGIESVIPGMIANLISLFSTHYFTKQKGGFVGIKDKAPLEQMANMRRIQYSIMKERIRNFNIKEFLNKNLPSDEITYFYLGLFSIISIYSTLYTLSRDGLYYNAELVDIIYHSVLILSTIFLSYPIWPNTVKSQYFIMPTWYIGITYILVFASSLLVIMSNFGQLQSMIFMLNLVVIATLTRWMITLPVTIIGYGTSIIFYKWFTQIPDLPSALDALEYKIIYALLLTSSWLIMFLKPKEDRQRNSDNLIKGQASQIMVREAEMTKALEVKYEFLRNINHEVRAPMTGFLSMGQALHENYENLSENDRKIAAKTIAESSDRLLSLMNNILDFSKISSLDFNLKLEKVNFSNLIVERTEHCQLAYLPAQKSLEFIFNIQSDIEIDSNKYYLSQTLDNLIINAIRYSESGSKITLALKTKLSSKNNLDNSQNFVEFTISDQGIGIPELDIPKLFEPFIVSSKTHTHAGGRGMGLALCKKVIESNNGKISVKNNHPSGVTFTILMPINNEFKAPMNLKASPAKVATKRKPSEIKTIKARK